MADTEINAELEEILRPLCKTLRENIRSIVKNTIPKQLSPYAKGFAEIWIQFLSGVYLYEALYNRGFLTLPEEGDNTPVACYISEN